MSYDILSEPKALAQCFRHFAKTINYRYTEFRHQRILGPPLDVGYEINCKGNEVFISKLPTFVFFDTLYSVFREFGRIYQIRIMLTQDNTRNNGLAYVSYFTEHSANRAVQCLNKYELAMGRRIEVRKSLDNRRLYIGFIPTNKSKDEIWKELILQGMRGIVDVITYRSYRNPSHNRGFAFIEFENHKIAASTIAKFHHMLLFSVPVRVEWSVPLIEVPDDKMQKSCKLFMRNLSVKWDAYSIANVVTMLVRSSCIEKVYKFKDYAFIHFYERADAEVALSLLKEHFAGSEVEIEWGKPRSRFTTPQYRHKKIAELIAKRDFEQSLNFSSKYDSNVTRCDFSANLMELRTIYCEYSSD